MVAGLARHSTTTTTAAAAAAAASATKASAKLGPGSIAIFDEVSPVFDELFRVAVRYRVVTIIEAIDAVSKACLGCLIIAFGRSVIHRITVREV